MGVYDEFVSVNAKGSAETEFISATISASVTAQAKTGPAAKDKARPVMEKLKSTVLAFADKAGVDTKRFKTTFPVEVDTHRSTGEFLGYKATYTMTFTATNVAAAVDLHDALTSIEGVVAPTPVFNVNDAVDVQTRAFADAVAKANAKFKGQCEALGLKVDDFAIRNWQIQEEVSRGKVLHFTEGAEAKPVGIEPGQAALDMRVTFNFERVKPTAP